MKMALAGVSSRNFSGLYFPIFGLNTERYSASVRIQLKYGKVRTRKTSNMLLVWFVNYLKPIAMHVFYRKKIKVIKVIKVKIKVI